MAYEPGPRGPDDRLEVDIIMCVVPEPPKGERNVLVSKDGRQEPLLVGTGQDNFLCGNCGAVLAGSVADERLGAGARERSAHRSRRSGPRHVDPFSGEALRARWSAGPASRSLAA